MLPNDWLAYVCFDLLEYWVLSCLRGKQFLGSGREIETQPVSLSLYYLTLDLMWSLFTWWHILWVHFLLSLGFVETVLSARLHLSLLPRALGWQAVLGGCTLLHLQFGDKSGSFSGKTHLSHFIKISLLSTSYQNMFWSAVIA